jgi:hypothetical protein
VLAVEPPRVPTWGLLATRSRFVQQLPRDPRQALFRHSGEALEGGGGGEDSRSCEVVRSFCPSALVALVIDCGSVERTIG